MCVCVVGGILWYNSEVMEFMEINWKSAWGWGGLPVPVLRADQVQEEGGTPPPHHPPLLPL